MCKFVFYQTAGPDRIRTNHGFILGKEGLGRELKNLISGAKNYESEDFMGLTGIADFDYIVPCVKAQNDNDPSDPEDESGYASLSAIELELPVFISKKANAFLQGLVPDCVLYYYMEEYVLTDETLELSGSTVRWHGKKLEEMKHWLEEQADKDA